MLLGFFDFRAEGAEFVPRRGGAILACNHQSFLDPVLVRAPLPRQLGYVARRTLFRNRAFSWLIRALGAIELDRESASPAGMRRIVDALHAGAALVLFPEGTRTRNGHVGDLKAGIALLVRKAGVPVIPVGLHGALDCWPRGRKLFRPGRIRVVYGAPVVYGRSSGRNEILSDLKERLVALHRSASELV